VGIGVDDAKLPYLHAAGGLFTALCLELHTRIMGPHMHRKEDERSGGIEMTWHQRHRCTKIGGCIGLVVFPSFASIILSVLFTLAPLCGWRIGTKRETKQVTTQNKQRDMCVVQHARTPDPRATGSCVVWCYYCLCIVIVR